VTAFTFSSHATDGIPDINIMFYTSFRQEPNICCPKHKKLIVPTTYYNTLGIHPQLWRARSRGTVFINSTNPFDPPLIFHNVFKDPIEADIMVEGHVLATKFAQSKAFQKAGMIMDQTAIPRCAHLHFGSEKYWHCALVGNVRPSVHGVGT